MDIQEVLQSLDMMTSFFLAIAKKLKESQKKINVVQEMFDCMSRDLDALFVVLLRHPNWGQSSGA